MVKLCLISTKLLPLINVTLLGIGVPSLSEALFKLCMGVDTKKECYGIAYPLIFSNNNRVMALDFEY